MAEDNKPAQSDVHEAAKILGKKGGKKGGPARARALSADERSAIAKAAAKARWAKAKSKKGKKNEKKD